MGGEIQWSALDAIADLVGARDIETFINHLVIIRDASRETE